MTRLLTLLFPLLLNAAVSAVHTGFNYGAFWGNPANVKKGADFRNSFNFARNLRTGTPFNSARLFTCKTQGTTDDPTEALDAAVETNVSLLLGFWTTPAKRGDPIKDLIDQELSALAKGFEKHGMKLSDLVIGLSVGSEDVYRFEDSPEEVGVPAKDISAAIATVKEAMKGPKFADYMKGKPIGHVDTAKHVVVDGADFYGMTAYPYWNKESAEKGKDSFLGSLDNVKQRAGSTPVWIAEMGWPYEGPQMGEAVAGKNSLQEFWTKVGCEVIGKYNTFWFELIKDSEAGQPDWGILDPATHEPRIDITVRVTTTIVVTVQPSGATSSIKASPYCRPKNSSASAVSKTTTVSAPSLLPSDPPLCITVADVAWDGQYVPIATNPAGPDSKCSPPPTYSGLTYGSSAPTASPSAAPPVVVPSIPRIVTSVAPPTSSPQARASSPAAPVVSNSPTPSAPASSPAPQPSGTSPPKACHKRR
ncbi:glycoside hydrolase [Phaeosphaeriaceae sp. SRC1lsM3a]|nr:glycoside hydrolase [Stagonospora sp. SRC1lsM3a]